MEGIEAQVGDDPRMVWRMRELLVAFPTAERNGANRQAASGFRLEDSQLEPTAAKMPPDGGWLTWDWHSPVVGW